MTRWTTNVTVSTLVLTVMLVLTVSTIVVCGLPFHEELLSSMECGCPHSCSVTPLDLGVCAADHGGVVTFTYNETGLSSPFYDDDTALFQFLGADVGFVPSGRMSLSLTNGSSGGGVTLNCSRAVFSLFNYSIALQYDVPMQQATPTSCVFTIPPHDDDDDDDDDYTLGVGLYNAASSPGVYAMTLARDVIANTTLFVVDSVSVDPDSSQMVFSVTPASSLSQCCPLVNALTVDTLAAENDDDNDDVVLCGGVVASRTSPTSNEYRLPLLPLACAVNSTVVGAHVVYYFRVRVLPQPGICGGFAVGSTTFLSSSSNTNANATASDSVILEGVQLVAVTSSPTTPTSSPTLPPFCGANALAVAVTDVHLTFPNTNDDCASACFNVTGTVNSAHSFTSMTLQSASVGVMNIPTSNAQPFRVTINSPTSAIYEWSICTPAATGTCIPTSACGATGFFARATVLAWADDCLEARLAEAPFPVNCASTSPSAVSCASLDGVVVGTPNNVAGPVWVNARSLTATSMFDLNSPIVLRVDGTSATSLPAGQIPTFSSVVVTSDVGGVQKQYVNLGVGGVATTYPDAAFCRANCSMGGSSSPSSAFHTVCAQELAVSGTTSSLPQQQQRDAFVFVPALAGLAAWPPGASQVTFRFTPSFRTLSGCPMSAGTTRYCGAATASVTVYREGSPNSTGFSAAAITGIVLAVVIGAAALVALGVVFVPNVRQRVFAASASVSSTRRTSTGGTAYRAGATNSATAMAQHHHDDVVERTLTTLRTRTVSRMPWARYPSSSYPSPSSTA